MDRAIHRETFDYLGRRFEVAQFHDDSGDTPNESEDGHGPVRYAEDRETLQRGEVVLCELQRGRMVYGFGAALVQASREGWGLGSEALQRLANRIGKKPTRGQIRAESVREDMSHLRGFYMGDWCYIGVSVRILGPDGEPEGADYEHALWGLESFGDYWEEVARELASDILHTRAAAWRAALREARARKYWASRDVQTRGA